MERWPPSYDAEDLRASIAQLVASQDFPSAFYGSLIEGGKICQGDVLQFRSPIPLLDEAGDAVAIDDVEYWLVVGNTCDFERVEVSWTQIVPIVEVPNDILHEQINDLRSYRLSRRFYLPQWGRPTKSDHLVADFLRPVALHKNAALEKCRVVARMTLPSWILLNACLVRFLARDDGRFDAP